MPRDDNSSTVRAVVQDAYGTADVLRVDQIPVPRIGDDDVLVRVHAAAVDRGTWHLMVGRPYLVRPVVGLRRPRQRVPGLDLAGVVEEVGANVSTFAVGDRVCGVGAGTFAELAAAKAAKLAIISSGLTFRQAAAVPISGMTAIQAVDQAGDIEGRRVLVTGASGGVGSYAVQIAVARGAHVTGVCSAAKADFVRSLGAVDLVDHAREDVTTRSEQFDAIIDIAGHASLARLRRILAPDGTIVFVGSETGGRWTGGVGRGMRAALRSPFVRQRFAMLVAKEQGTDVDRVLQLIDDGSVTPQVDRTYPLERAAEALRDLESGVVKGKLVIDVAG